MAINNFVPEIWDANLLLAMRNQLVYAQPGMVNRDYEGDISQAGDTVHITSIGDPAVRAYTRNAGVSGGSPAAITYDLLTDNTEPFVISQADYFAFQVDDIDKRQALSGFVQEASVGAAYNLTAKVDTYVSGLMATGVATGNKLGAINVGVGSGTTTESTPKAVVGVYDMLVQLRTKLNRSNTPGTGRWAVIPPEMYALLLLDPRFIRANESGSTDALRNGAVGRAAGFDVVESNVVPSTGSGASQSFTVLAGHAVATTFAQQILETEALRLQSGFSDAVRGLHVYDAKVLAGRNANLASAVCTIDTAPLA